MKPSEFEVLQLLNETGHLAGEVPESLDEDGLIDLYYSMMLTRLYDQKAIALQRTGQLGTYASSLGQEAIGAAIGAVMRPEDVLLPAYREYAAQLQRGVLIEELLLYWGGDERGSKYSVPVEDFPVCVPIASQTCHAVGVAYAFKYRKQPRVAVCVLGDGATSKGDFYESINIAGVQKLPVVFVVNNNQWAISVPRSRQSAAETIAHKAFSAGIKGLRVDGNDVIGLYGLLESALEQCRKSAGPVLVEAITYRLCDHTTADDAGRYRAAEEVAEAEKREPVARLKKFLVKEGIWDSQAESDLIKGCEATISEAVERYLKAEPQPAVSMFDSLYQQLPAALQKQRNELLEEVDRNG